MFFTQENSNHQADYYGSKVKDSLGQKNPSKSPNPRKPSPLLIHSAGFEYAETVWISKMIGRVYSGKRFYGVTYQALWICIDPIFGGTPSDYQACVFRDSSVTYQIASLFSMNDSNNETF